MPYCHLPFFENRASQPTIYFWKKLIFNEQQHIAVLFNIAVFYRWLYQLVTMKA
jgi:hypothetical protein